MGRARKLQLFLTQPFGVVSEWTRWESMEVSIADTLAGAGYAVPGQGRYVSVSGRATF